MWLVPLLSLGLSARRLAPVGSEGASQRVLQQERAEFVRVALLTPATARSAALSLLCPIACSGMGLIGKDFDPALLSLIISTPSAFSINAAYVRRERAFVALAQLRAAAWNIHLDARRWGCGEDAAAASEAMRVVWASFIREIRVAADKCSSPDRKQQVRGGRARAGAGARSYDSGHRKVTKAAVEANTERATRTARSGTPATTTRGSPIGPKW
jgi:hypothetical protein